RWAVGKKVGVALVQADDGVAQAVGGEDLVTVVLPARIDLDQEEILDLVRADIERPADEPAPRHRLAAERERVAERGEWLEPVGPALGLEQRAEGGEGPLLVVDDAARM